MTVLQIISIAVNTNTAKYGGINMGKFSSGLFAGAVIGMGVAMLDRRTMKKAKRMAKSMMHSMYCSCR